MKPVLFLSFTLVAVLGAPQSNLPNYRDAGPRQNPAQILRDNGQYYYQKTQDYVKTHNGNTLLQVKQYLEGIQLGSESNDINKSFDTFDKSDNSSAIDPTTPTNNNTTTTDTTIATTVNSFIPESNNTTEGNVSTDSTEHESSETTTTASPFDPETTTTASPIDPETTTEPPQLTGGAIAGIVIACLVGVALIGGGIYYIYKENMWCFKNM